MVNNGRDAQIYVKVSDFERGKDSPKGFQDLYYFNYFVMEPGMKIRVESEKIIKAVKKLDGIEIVLENADDGKEALNLIMRKTGLFNREDSGKLKDVTVTSLQKYETSAVDYKMIFLLEFIFEKDVTLETKVGILKEFQEFFNKI